MTNPSATPTADVDAHRENGVLRLVFSGTLTAQSLGAVARRLQAAAKTSGGRVVFDLAGLERLDTSGALLLNETADACRAQGAACEFANVSERFGALLEKSRLDRREKASARAGRTPPLLDMLNTLGKSVCEQLSLIGQLVGFLGAFLVTLGRLAANPARLRFTSLVFHMEQVGLRAVPIVALLTFLIGMVVAYMGAQQLVQFGAQVFAVKLLEVTVMREMAVLITAIVVAGRSSSSFTAQIGAMVANEEVDALRSMGLEPSQLLVVPRVLAIIICLPMLTFIADIAALAGGAAALRFTMDLRLDGFLAQLQEVAELSNFVVGIAKTPFFAVAIGLVGCFQGFRATSSAESVGFLTTISVVQAIFIVILLDALFAIFFTALGI